MAHFELYPSVEVRFSGLTIVFVPISLIIAAGWVLQSRNKSQLALGHEGK
jgi:hypothetical protein